MSDLEARVARIEALLAMVPELDYERGGDEDVDTVTTARAHSATCRRLDHSGPCDGPLRADFPETPAEAYLRRRQAVEAVLIRRLRAGSWLWDQGQVRKIAAECLSAADAGF